MPPPSDTHHLPATHPATRQRPKSPNRVLAEAEAQWLFTEEELTNTPSIHDGMSLDDERDSRAKGINFILQVGIMLKLPQLTLSTASIFFQRFLMRASLKKTHNGIPKLHHFQVAATALFLAGKVEESCRKMREQILAFCRVAQKNPNLIVDEQSKDFWKWRDSILHNEDHMLETLCFDLTVESPHRQLFDMLKYYGVEHNKRLRNAAWGFVTDSNNTQLCLLVSSRTLAAASLYAGCKFCEVTLPDDAKGGPWWETQHVRLQDINRAVQYMLSNYDISANKVNGISVNGGSDGNGSIYAGLLTPAMDGSNDAWDRTRVRTSASPFPESERRHSNASSLGVKRSREDEGGPKQPSNIDSEAGNRVPSEQKESKRQRLEEPTELGGENKKVDPNTAAVDGMDVVLSVPEAPADGGEPGGLKEHEEALRADERREQQQTEQTTQLGERPLNDVARPKRSEEEEEGEVSEEGEVEE